MHYVCKNTPGPKNGNLFWRQTRVKWFFMVEKGLVNIFAVNIVNVKLDGAKFNFKGGLSSSYAIHV